MRNELLTFLILVSTLSVNSQDLAWTGNASNSDFFDEENWQNSSTNLPPSAGTIDPNQAININLQISDAGLTEIVATGVINLGTGTLSITNSSLKANAISSGSLVINGDAYLTLSDTSPLQNNVSVNFTSDVGWIRTLSKKPSEILNDHLSQFAINSSAAVYQSNLRLDNYYSNGTIIRGNQLTANALSVYNNTFLGGTSSGITTDVVHNGTGIPNNMNDNIESFVLKKGYMATFAILEDGTGKSKNYIASEEDLIINELPSYLANDISFIRVVPWNWVTKKGVGGVYDGIDHSWYYNWGNGNNSNLPREYAPMSWGYGGANDDADITNYKSKYKVTHVLAFNESDQCDKQSGQYNNLCDTDVAVSTYKNLMKTGLRLVSPSCTENAPFGWLKEFHDKANAQDIRIDVIGVHWYDWGSNPASSPNANPENVFNRFKNYLQRVYDLYGLPIWITEFNANPNRSTATNYAFMQLALPYLETLDYVERYCWYQPNSGVADYYTDANQTTLTDVGVYYNNQSATPSVPEASLAADSNLDIYYANSLSIDEVSTSTIVLFPNPSTGYIRLRSSASMASYKIYNTTGQLIQSVWNLDTNETEINLRNHNTGLYFILVKDTTGNIFSEKLLLN
ncbi:glycosyl hydrolase [Gaetbulibacter sp. M240]|uniref:glycosyl hydrolase n=1 Tax=Gaetbulibacter sp. M240 TaxID=3126511 RepID=UPI00374E6CAA